MRVHVSPLRRGSYIVSFVRWQLSSSVDVSVASVTSTGSAVEPFKVTFMVVSPLRGGSQLGSHGSVVTISAVTLLGLPELTS